MRHDVGEKLGFIETSIHYALREDLKDDLLAYLSGFWLKFGKSDLLHIRKGQLGEDFYHELSLIN